MQAPFGINPNTAHQVLVSQGATLSLPITIDVAAAQPAVFGDPATSAANAVQLSGGGQEVTPLFAGLTPGFVGLYQVNAIPAAGTPKGDAVPVTLTVAGQTSPVVTIAIE